MDKLIQHFTVWEKVGMALSIIVAMSIGVYNSNQGEDYAWQIIAILWIVSCWLKTNKIEELENK
jgi:hypothetical protein